MKYLAALIGTLSILAGCGGQISSPLAPSAPPVSRVALFKAPVQTVGAEPTRAVAVGAAFLQVNNTRSAIDVAMFLRSGTTDPDFQGFETLEGVPSFSDQLQVFNVPGSEVAKSNDSENYYSTTVAKRHIAPRGQVTTGGMLYASAIIERDEVELLLNAKDNLVDVKLIGYPGAASFAVEHPNKSINNLLVPHGFAEDDNKPTYRLDKSQSQVTGALKWVGPALGYEARVWLYQVANGTFDDAGALISGESIPLVTLGRLTATDASRNLVSILRRPRTSLSLDEGEGFDQILAAMFSGQAYLAILKNGEIEPEWFVRLRVARG